MSTLNQKQYQKFKSLIPKKHQNLPNNIKAFTRPNKNTFINILIKIYVIRPERNTNVRRQLIPLAKILSETAKTFKMHTGTRCKTFHDSDYYDLMITLKKNHEQYISLRPHAIRRFLCCMQPVHISDDITPQYQKRQKQSATRTLTQPRLFTKRRPSPNRQQYPLRPLDPRRTHKGFH